MSWTAFTLPLILLAGWWWLRRATKLHIYNPKRGLGDSPEDVGLEFDEVPFIAEDMTRLYGWWIPKEDALGTVICLHGKSGNISNRLHWARDLHRLPVNVFLFDYRGFGVSKGYPNERGLYRDAHAAYEVVRGYYDDADEPPVVLFGRSLGASVAVQLALDKGARGVVVESGFTSLTKLALEREWPEWFIKLFLRQEYPTLERIGELTCPVLVAHSREDDLIPFDMGKALHAASGSSRPLVETKGTHDESGWATTPAYWNHFEQFVLSSLGVRV